MLPRYYYHSQTHETRWEPPSGGFLSIKEQRELRGEKEEVVQAGSDEEEDEEEKEGREKQALLAAHQAKKQQVEQSEAHRLETTEFKIALIIKDSLYDCTCQVHFQVGQQKAPRSPCAFAWCETEGAGACNHRQTQDSV